MNVDDSLFLGLFPHDSLYMVLKLPLFTGNGLIILSEVLCALYS